MLAKCRGKWPFAIWRAQRRVPHNGEQKTGRFRGQEIRDETARKITLQDVESEQPQHPNR